MKKVTFAGLVFLSGVFAHSAERQKIVLQPGITCRDINTAIKSLGPEGGDIYLPAGIIDCDEMVNIERSHVALIGKGRGDRGQTQFTKLLMRNGEPTPVLVLGVLPVTRFDAKSGHGIQSYPTHEIEDVTVKNLAVDANRFASPKNSRHMDFECYDAEKKQSLNCTKVKTDQNGNIEYMKDEKGQLVYEKDSSGRLKYDDNKNPIKIPLYEDSSSFVRNNAITIRRVKLAWLENVSADRSFSGGLTVEKLSSYLHIKNFTARQNALDGFAGYETHSSNFKDLYLMDNPESGISIDMSFEASKAPELKGKTFPNVFENVYLIGNGKNGVFSHSLSGTVFKNMKIMGNGEYGLFIDGHRELQQDGSWVLTPGTCDKTIIQDVIAINNKLSSVKFNHYCQNSVIKNLRSIKTIDAKIEENLNAQLEQENNNLNALRATISGLDDKRSLTEKRQLEETAKGISQRMTDIRVNLWKLGEAKLCINLFDAEKTKLLSKNVKCEINPYFVISQEALDRTAEINSAIATVRGL
ncbi:MAG: hypothetical protein RJB66_1597 [Pseudomonadota bacterium]|jgi:hypothetical protein